MAPSPMPTVAIHVPCSPDRLISPRAIRPVAMATIASAPPPRPGMARWPKTETAPAMRLMIAMVLVRPVDVARPASSGVFGIVVMARTPALQFGFEAGPAVVSGSLLRVYLMRGNPGSLSRSPEGAPACTPTRPAAGQAPLSFLKKVGSSEDGFLESLQAWR